jgi:hypothetical protein
LIVEQVSGPRATSGRFLLEGLSPGWRVFAGGRFPAGSEPKIATKNRAGKIALGSLILKVEATPGIEPG